LEDHPRRAAQIAARDFLDERRHVDVGGAGVRAWRVEAKQALARLEQRGVAGQRRRDLREIPFQDFVRRRRVPLPASSTRPADGPRRTAYRIQTRYTPAAMRNPTNHAHVYTRANNGVALCPGSEPMNPGRLGSTPSTSAATAIQFTPP